MSKLLLYDFRCPNCGTVFEELVKPDEKTAPCLRCQLPAERQIPAPRINHYEMATSDSASPGSISYFEKIHRQRRAIEDKSMREHGDYGTAAGSDGGSPITPDRAAHLG